MSKNKPAKAGKRELFLIGGVLLAALLLFIGTRLFYSRPAAAVEVTIDGKTVATLDLHKDQELTIESVTGGTNHLIIKNGEAWVSDATCPDKICVHQGKVSRDGEMIVCLPNLMIARITGE